VAWHAGRELLEELVDALEAFRCERGDCAGEVLAVVVGHGWRQL
jgi:hypothetical protein